MKSLHIQSVETLLGRIQANVSKDILTRGTTWKGNRSS